MRSPLRKTLFAGLLLLLVAASAGAQEAAAQLQGEAIFVGEPALLYVQAVGFDEEPPPEIETPSIADAKLQFLGSSPQVSSRISIINGRTSEEREVRFRFDFEVVPERAGVFQVPAIEVRQGARRARTRPLNFQATVLPTTPDMQLRLEWPAGPLYVNQRAELGIAWYLRRDIQGYSLRLPFFDLSDRFAFEDVPAPRGQLALRVRTRQAQLDIPATQEPGQLDGQAYTVVRARRVFIPQVAGSIEIPPAQVLAHLKVGVRRDVFGLEQAQTQPFTAASEPQRLEVRPLPLTNRPACFAGAVGASFQIDVRADRSVVALGEPITLRIAIQGQGQLAGAGLPPLEAMGLDPARFQIPAGDAAGERGPKGELMFQRSVRVKSADVREIPALGYGYFDPSEQRYQVAQSQPIALSVKGSKIVGALDVVAAGDRVEDDPTARPSATRAQALPGSLHSLSGADLSLSRLEEALRPPPQPAPWAWLSLHLLPLALLIATAIYRRGGAARAVRRQAAGRRRERLAAIEGAAARPPRQAADLLARTLRDLAGTEPARSQELRSCLDELDRLAYSSGETATLDPALLERARRLARTLGPIALLFMLAAGARGDQAAPPDAELLRQAREAYARAMEQPDRARRLQEFRRAAQGWEQLAQRGYIGAELLTDLGNAYLAAEEPGPAILAYRRALLADPGLRRARLNIEHARGLLPAGLPRPAGAGALDRLFFWHSLLAAPHKAWAASLAFAAALMLLVLPRRSLRHLAWLPLAVWLALWASYLAEPDPTHLAVLTAEGTIGRTADTPGAQASFNAPLPAGLELTVRAEREGFVRVALADGQECWLDARAIERLR